MAELLLIASALPTGVLAWTPGYPEIIVILVVILLLFGGKKLPELARGLARGLRTFKDEMMGIKTDIEKTDQPKEDESQATEESQDEGGESQQ